MPYFDILSQFAPEEILVYLRKSRSDDPDLTVEEVLQRHQKILQEWIERNLSGPIPEENYFREVVSGEQLDTRPEMMKILKLIENPKYKAILCIEPQRLSRGDLYDAGMLIRLLKYTRTQVITPMKTFDIENEYDRDAFERELKRGNEYLEYTKKILGRGKLQSVRDGNYIGSKPPYGYDKTIVYDGKKKCPTLTINEREAEVVRLVFDMYVNQGLGLSTIVYRLDAAGYRTREGRTWGRSTVRQMLENVVYIGKIRYGFSKEVHVVQDHEVIKKRQRFQDYEIIDGKHEPIIDEELFYKVQSKMNVAPKKNRKKELSNPLAGLIFCAECGYAITYRDYNDVANAKPRFYCHKKSIHRSGTIAVEEMLEVVADTLEKEIPNFKLKLSENSNSEEQRVKAWVVSLEKRLIELNKKEVSLWEKYTEEAMPKEVFESLKEKVLKEKEETKALLESESQKAFEKVDYSEKIATFQKAIDLIRSNTATADELNVWLKCCIERITFTRNLRTRVSKSNDDTNSRGWVDEPAIIHIDLKL